MFRSSILACALVLAACGGDDGNGTSDGGTTQADAAAAQPLACKSIALCTTYDVKTFIGTIPAPAGGAITDGIYRLQYAMDPPNIDEEPRYSEGLEALQIRGNQFNWAGFHRDELGTYATSGTTITFQSTRYCSRGTDGDPTSSKLDYKFTATGDQLHLYGQIRRSDGVQWDRLYVYVKAGSPQAVCGTVASDPATPGDSARCRVTNCACSFAIEGTVDECT